MPDVGDKERERMLRDSRPPEVEGVQIDWSELPHPGIRDLRGMRFGKLVVKAYARTIEKANGSNAVYWLCQCDCGTDHEVTRERLTRGLTKSCGCLSPVGHKGVLACRERHKKRSNMIKRVRVGLPPVTPISVIGDPAWAFAQDSLMAYACLQWAGYEPAAHHHLIAKYLQKVEQGKLRRLMIFVPPRHGKSMIISQFFPAWYLGRNPENRIITTSYGQELASDFGRLVRNQIADPMFQDIFPGVALSGDSAAADKFDLAPPHRGGYFAVGAGGAITGRGANCFVSGTKILTNKGNLSIENLTLEPTPVKILSFNTREYRLEYQEIKAFASRQGFGIYRITTNFGRMVEVTGEHPVFVQGKGYIEASALAPGDPIVCVLQKGIYSPCISDAKAHQKKTERQLLFSRMFGIASRSKKSTPLQYMRKSCRKKGKTILQWMSAKIRRVQRKVSASKNVMPNLQHSFYGKVARTWTRKICSILQQTMCGNWSFYKNDWEREPALVTWTRSIKKTTTFGKIIQNNETTCFKKGQQYLRVLWRNLSKITRTSFRRECNEQCCIQFSDSLPEMPCENPCNDGFRTGHDAVESVVRVRETATVYDIQVESNHNLFANGILCHNCLIIDDILKGPEEADSESHRRKMNDWYASVAYTRLMDKGAIILVMTRWHVMDLAGWLLKEHKHEKWTVLNLPAINDKGEALWPERYPLEELQLKKDTLTARQWEALYQQKPFVDEGGIFKRMWWKLWPDNKKIPDCEFIIQSWDTAFTDRDLKRNSFSARVTLGVFKRPDDECHSIFLLESWKGRVEYSELRKEAVKAYQDYAPDKVIIEKKASGLILIQDLRRAGLPLVAYTPTKDKITRAYAAQSLLENGRIYYPSRRWAEDFIGSLAAFPQASDDDEADAFSQAIIWLQNSFLVVHADDAKRRKEEEEREDEELPENVTKFRPRNRRKAAYG